VTLDDDAVAQLQTAVLTWFDRQARAFEFRGIRDPYAILVSEVILQQTQASRGEPAWRAFMARFPTVGTLAAALPADVLRQWSGLGYNRRAVNLQRAARAIVERHGGRVPDDLAALRALPGVGPYTARAVAAIAFGRPVGPVDTNVRRVLGRVAAGHGSARDHGEPLPAHELQALADAVVPAERPADWTAALMDIGATVCKPSRPDCADCPIAALCRFATVGADQAVPASVAAPVRSRRRTAEGAAPYQATNRWLRGRIMARLSAVPDDAWVTVEAPLGSHGHRAVAVALEGLRSEGLVETDGSGRWRLPAG
jgi:A/G-specific adenine glycosylase